MQLIKVDERVGRELRFREQPRTACKPGISVAPLSDLVRRGGPLDLGDRIQVHGVCPGNGRPQARMDTSREIICVAAQATTDDSLTRRLITAALRESRDRCRK